MARAGRPWGPRMRECTGVIDPLALDASTLAAAIAAGDVTATDAVSACLARIDAIDGALHAFVDVRAEAALEDARAVDARRAAGGRGSTRRPLEGVPVTVKSAIDVAGLRCETGSPSRRDLRAARDAVVVMRLRRAGAIVLGTTNVAEMLMGYESTNPLHGTTVNPWRHDRTAGGSSGGEAAAIAAGCSFAGLGSDGGGSVRVPAAFTGICGHKPTPGLVPSTGHQPACLGPFSLVGVIGPMARSVADLVRLMDVLAGYDPGDPSSAPSAWRLGPVEPTRVVTWFDSHPAHPATPEIQAAVRTAVATLEAQGYETRPELPPLLDGARACWDVLFGDAGDLLLGELVGASARTLPILEALHRERGPRPPLTAARLVDAWATHDTLRAQCADALGGGVIVCPVTSVPAFAHGARQWTVGGCTVGYLDAMAYTQWANVLGAPAAVVPVGSSGDGLPIGVQVIGAPWMDAHVLAVAAAIERGRGPLPRPPAVPR